MSKLKKTKEIKQRGLFDHINHIRQSKSPDYLSTLNDGELKTFNHYMICRILSMDSSIIEEVALISKYFNKMDSGAFYKLCCEIVPSGRAFFPYIKRKGVKINKDLLEYVCNKFEVGMMIADEYCRMLYSTDAGIEELKSICRGYGLTDKETDKLVVIKD